MRKLPPLSTLRAFEAAARSSSFSKAADELCLTPAAVAHQIKKLETDLDLKLFVRKHRGVELNNTGKEYLRIVTRLFDEFALETQRLKARSETLTLHIVSLHAFAEKWLMPRIGDFRARYPDIHVELKADVKAPDFHMEDTDIWICHSENPPEGLYSEALIQEKLFPVCSPDIIGACKSPLDIDELRDQPALYDLFWRDDWRIWLKRYGVEDLTVIPETLGFNLYSMVVQAAVEGTGVAIGHDILVENEIRKGKLVTPFDTVATSPLTYYFATPQELLNTATVQAFHTWIKETIANEYPNRTFN